MKFDTKEIILTAVLTFASVFVFLKFIWSPDKWVESATKQAENVNISGNWSFYIDDPAPSTGQTFFEVSLSQNGNSLLGTYFPQVALSGELAKQAKIIRGEVRDGKLSFLFLIETFPLMEFKGKIALSGDEIGGQSKFNTGNGFFDQPDRAWRAKKLN